MRSRPPSDGVLAQAENAYVKATRRRRDARGPRDAAAPRRYRRTEPARRREVLSKSGRVSGARGRGPRRTLLRNSTEGYVRRTLRRMTQRVYREYQRRLWELPAADGRGGRVLRRRPSTTRRCASARRTPGARRPASPPRRAAAARRSRRTASGTSTSGAAAPWASSPSTRSTSGCTTAAPV